MHCIKKLAVVGALVAASVGLPATIAAADDSPNSPTATGNAWDSPGILSGNVIQLPISIPVNACGDNIGLLGALGVTSGTVCANG